MVFSSYIFIFAFLPAVLIVYYALSKLKNPIYQRVFLIVASLFFYGYYNVKYLILIVVSIVINYLLAFSIQQNKRIIKKLFLTIGVLFNVGLLGYFKYYDFFLENINVIFGTSFALRNILLPLGISFFTFQQLSFLVSIYKEEEKVAKISDYILFVTFFPQLVAGPIVLYSEMIPQFMEEKRRYFNNENFSSGLYIFAMGVFKKAVIADTLAVFVNNGFGMTDIGLAAGWAISLSYTLQLYFDFSGYSDMAIGLGKMFNINIPFNFLSPYKSKSITEFWKKWHITLGRALTTYIYIPLGGNRKDNARTCLNLFITFFVSGLWHGAAWTFVLWGVFHGVFRVVEKLLGEERMEKIPCVLRVLGTFLIVNGLWVLFRAENFGQALEIYKGMLSFGNVCFSQLETVVGVDGGVNLPAIIDYGYILSLISALLYVVFCRKNSVYQLEKFTASKKTLVAAAVMFTISLLCLSRESVFIYFNF